MPTRKRRSRPPTTTNPVRARRRALGMSLEELAHRTGLSVSTVSRIERGVSTPHKPTLRLLASTLACDVETLA